MNVSLRALALGAVTTAALVVAASAAAHARVSPPVALSKSGQLFTLAVPTEKEGVTTTKVVLTRRVFGRIGPEFSMFLPSW